VFVGVNIYDRLPVRAARSDSAAVRRAAPRSTVSFNRFSPSTDGCRIPPGPSLHASGVVVRKLSVLTIIPAAPRLPTAEAWGASGLAAIKEPNAIWVIPTSRASFRAPSFLRSREVSGLAVTSGVVQVAVAGVNGALAGSGVRERFPLFELPLDECRPLGGVAVQHGGVVWVGTEVDPGGPCLEGVGALRARCPVAAGAVGALELGRLREAPVVLP